MFTAAVTPGIIGGTKKEKEPNQNKKTRAKVLDIAMDVKLCSLRFLWLLFSSLLFPFLFCSRECTWLAGVLTTLLPPLAAAGKIFPLHPCGSAMHLFLGC